uniref:GYF domain-containing protein n=1 Tax=Ascaris lumbricoides TaxID=6252 RepID=A0A0M3HGC1_ASCLU
MKLKNGCSLPHQRSLDLANAFSVSTDATRGRWDFFAFGWGGGRGGGKEKWKWRGKSLGLRPYSSTEMLRWCRAGYFAESMPLRTEGEDRFHTLAEWTRYANGQVSDVCCELGIIKRRGEFSVNSCILCTLPTCPKNALIYDDEEKGRNVRGYMQQKIHSCLAQILQQKGLRSEECLTRKSCLLVCLFIYLAFFYRSGNFRIPCARGRICFDY